MSRVLAPVAICVAVLLMSIGRPAWAERTETAKALPDDGAASAYFGCSSSISETSVLIGAKRGGLSGSAYLFDVITGQQRLKFSPNDGAVDDGFGSSVGIASTLAVVGAPWDDDNGIQSGSSYVFDTATGSQLRKLRPADGAAGDQFGASVAISGHIVIAGAQNDDDRGDNAGAAYLLNAATGQQLFKLLPYGYSGGDSFGRSVGISGTTAIVGAWLDDDNGASSGSAYLFNATTGQQIAKLLPSDGAEYDIFGLSVAISGAIALVGAQGDGDNGPGSGSAYLFDATTGEQLHKLLPSDGAAGDKFGSSVAISGSIAIIGAEQGEAAYLFDTTAGHQIDKLVASDGGEDDRFGSSVAISGQYAIVGSENDDDNGPYSGSAYFFDGSGARISFRIAEAGTSLIAGARLSGRAAKAPAGAKQSTRPLLQASAAIGLVVFDRAYLESALSGPFTDIDRVEFLDASGNVVGHMGFQYRGCDLDSERVVDAFVFLHNDNPDWQMTPAHSFWQNKVDGWEYYAENEYPMSMLVPPGGDISNVTGGSDQPVVFIHGIGDYFTGTWPDCGIPICLSSPLWEDIPERIDQETYDSWRFYYPHDQWIPDSSVLLDRAIGEVLSGTLSGIPAYDPGMRVDVVAHSMGGLVTRSYLQGQDYQDNVGKLLMLGTPNHGSHASYRAERGDITADIMDAIQLADKDAPAHEAMTPASEYLFGLHASPPASLGSGAGQEDHDYLVVAGVVPYDCLDWDEKHSEINLQDDGFVAVSSASLLNYGVPLLVVDAHHRNIKLHDDLPKTIEKFLGGYDPPNESWSGFGWIRCFLTTSNLSPCENEEFSLQEGILELRLDGADQDADRFKIEDSGNGVLSLRNESGAWPGYGNQYLIRASEGAPEFFSRVQRQALTAEVGVRLDQGSYDLDFYRRECKWGCLATKWVHVGTSTSRVLFSPLRTTIQEVDVNAVGEFAANASNGAVLSGSGKISSAYAFEVDQGMSTVLFNLSGEEGGDLTSHGMFLVEPGGRIIDTAVAGSDPDIDFALQSTRGPAQYLVRSPLPGVWTIQHDPGLVAPHMVAYVDGSFVTRIEFPGSGFVAGDSLVCAISVVGQEACQSVSLQADAMYTAPDSTNIVPLGPVALTDLGGGLYEGLIVTDSAGEYQVALSCDCTPAAGPVLVRQSFANVWVDRHPDDVTAAPPVDGPPLSDGKSSVCILSASPNPFNPSVTIAFENRVPGRARVEIYTLNGRRVASLLESFLDAGVRRVVWRGRDDSGAPVASGVYLVQVSLEGTSVSQKVVLLK